MTENNNDKPSPIRLRIGVFLIIIWWVPFWLLAPYIASLFGSSTDTHLTAMITTTIVILQTIIGFFGVLVAGKEIKPIIKDTPRKQVLKKIWLMLLHGSLDA